MNSYLTNSNGLKLIAAILALMTLGSRVLAQQQPRVNQPRYLPTDRFQPPPQPMPQGPLPKNEKIYICHAGLVELESFDKHVNDIRELKRHAPEKIDSLIEGQRKYGPDYFASQIFIQLFQSGSGTYDLQTFHGLKRAAKYRNVTAWDCTLDDYPIAYFVGFRVRDIQDGAIRVSREQDVVNVISLKALDPKLDKHTKVKIFEGDKVLCEDIGTGCVPAIFYSRE